MNYEVLSPLKVRTPEGIRELQTGEVVTLPAGEVSWLLESGKVKPSSPDCFSPDGLLELAFEEGITQGWTDERFLDLVETLLREGCLKAPWGFRVKDSPLIGDYWIVSDTTARTRIPVQVTSFTLEELKPLVEASRVFPGAKVVSVLKRQGAVNA